MFMKKSFNKNGFTIIELLIVIVVIGILATLALNAFGTVQQKARNTQRVTTAAALAKAMKLYIADNNSYPTTPGSYCAGSGYNDEGGTALGDCRIHRVNGSVISERANAISALQPYAGSIDVSGGSKPQWFGNYDYTGPIIAQSTSYSIDGGSEGGHIMYFPLEGTQQDCGLAALDGPWGNWTTVNTNGGNFSSSSSTYDGTLCIIQLDEPR